MPILEHRALRNLRFDASSNQLVLEVSTGSGKDDPGEIVITANTEARWAMH